MKFCYQCNQKYADEEILCPKDGIRLVVPGADPLIGTVVENRYRIEEIVGRGAMGIVYRATQEFVGRKVAVKILNANLVGDKDSLKRFHHEARAASKLNHPNIVSVYDYGILPGGRPYLAMDFLKGMPLSRILKERKYLTPQEALPIFQQVCAALAFAHAHGVIHRDVKPDNIVLVDAGQNKRQVKVVDFGIAKVVQQEGQSLTKLTRQGTICGSPTYMAPERFEDKKVDQRSDIYSLGISLYETLTGAPPFKSSTIQGLMTLHLTQSVPPLGEALPEHYFPDSLNKLLELSLAKAPSMRIQTMKEFAEELKVVQAELSHLEVAVSQTTAPVAVQEAVVASRQDFAQVYVDRVKQKLQKIAEKEERRQAFLEEQATPKARHLPSYRERWRAPISVKLVAFLQTLFPYVLTLLLLASLVIYLSKGKNLALPELSRLFAFEPKAANAEDLIRQGKWLDAAFMLEEKHKQGKLSKQEFEELNWLYIGLAKHQAKLKDYGQALSYLKRVDSKSSAAKKAKLLEQKYRHRQK